MRPAPFLFNAMTLTNNTVNDRLLYKSALWTTPDLTATPNLAARFDDPVAATSRAVALAVTEETERYFRFEVELGPADDLPGGVIALATGAHYEVTYLAQADGPDPPPAVEFWRDIIRIV